MRPFFLFLRLKKNGCRYVCELPVSIAMHLWNVSRPILVVMLLQDHPPIPAFQQALSVNLVLILNAISPRQL